MTSYFPPQNVVEDKLLHMLYSRMRPVQTTVVYRALADQFCLARHERRGVRGDPKGSAWEYLVRQARKNLADKGWINSPETGQWALTEVGREEARKREIVSASNLAPDMTAVLASSLYEANR